MPRPYHPNTSVENDADSSDEAAQGTGLSTDGDCSLRSAVTDVAATATGKVVGEGVGKAVGRFFGRFIEAIFDGL